MLSYGTKEVEIIETCVLNNIFNFNLLLQNIIRLLFFNNMFTRSDQPFWEEKIS